MAQVDIEVNGRAYRVFCQDGQEARLRELAAFVDAKLKQVTGGGKSGSEAQMLVLTAIVMADEMQDVMAGRGLASLSTVSEAEMAAAVDNVALRIEEVAARLERA
ncbi:cell division protein ZapA [Roseomonas genomospecies 6]|uniref:Cell division protein ZapA n=1 Tax=Roseomonas genomospecies 6 TaxID=214106 RepID=A0A9W7NMU4_9PROT|nr:cell division protein ZapA [Roseomonas genomospecies 6]KAA0683411.1 cell division protein ZapA [Roseomonas genomospecies 6]